MRSITVPIVLAVVAHAQLAPRLLPAARLARPLPQPYVWSLDARSSLRRGLEPVRAEGFVSKLDKRKSRKPRLPETPPDPPPVRSNDKTTVFQIKDGVCEEAEVPDDKVKTVIMVGGLMMGDCYSRGYRTKVGSKPLKIPFFGDFELITYQKKGGSAQLELEGQLIERAFGDFDIVTMPLVLVISLLFGHVFTLAVLRCRRGGFLAMDKPLLTSHTGRSF